MQTRLNSLKQKCFVFIKSKNGNITIFNNHFKIKPQVYVLIKSQTNNTEKEQNENI